MPVEWSSYQARLGIIERLVGGIPVIPEGAERADAYESWARGQGVEAADALELGGKLAADEEMPTLEEGEKIEGLHTGFRSDSVGIYIEARQVKAMIREAAQRLALIKNVRGFRQVLQHDLIVRAGDGSQKLRLLREGEIVTAPDGTDRRPISVVTRQGPRTAIKVFDYVGPAEIVCVIRVLAGGIGDGLVDQARLSDVLEFAGEALGLGADRSQGEGTFRLLGLEAS